MTTKKIELLQVREATNKEVRNPEDVYLMMQEEAKADRECMWVIHLNSRKKVIDKELIAMGTLDSAITSPREVFRKAIIQGSSSIIMVHNHPSGNPDPSLEDLKIERALKKASKILDLPLVDFMIIGNGFYSFQERIYKQKRFK